MLLCSEERMCDTTIAYNRNCRKVRGALSKELIMKLKCKMGSLEMLVPSPPDSGTGIQKGPAVRTEEREEPKDTRGKNLGECGMPTKLRQRTGHVSFRIFIPQAITATENFKPRVLLFLTEEPSLPPYRAAWLSKLLIPHSSIIHTSLLTFSSRWPDYFSTERLGTCFSSACNPFSQHPQTLPLPHLRPLLKCLLVHTFPKN